jgi:small subunit ribosomal protein S16
MVVIRLSRGGARGAPFFNIVVADSRNRRDGRYIERLGFYNPVGKEGAENVRIAQERVSYWVSKGAQMSDTVAQLAKGAAKAAFASAAKAATTAATTAAAAATAAPVAA